LKNHVTVLLQLHTGNVHTQAFVQNGVLSFRCTENETL